MTEMFDTNQKHFSVKEPCTTHEALQWWYNNFNLLHCLCIYEACHHLAIVN